MARYYHKMGSAITERFDSHHEAERRFVERVIQETLRPGDIEILLDVNSIGHESSDELKKLLLSDPALSMIFKMGREIGWNAAEQYWRTLS